MRGCANATVIVASLLAVAADDPPVKTFPITVKGRAVDAAGKPIAGAKVYIASQAASWKRLAETTTDDKGRYEFRDVALPIEQATTNEGRDVGAFEVFGQAAGHGFAWRPKKWFYPNGKPAGLLETEDAPGWFDAEDEIVLDLKFTRSASFKGQITDEQKRPIAGASVAIRACDPERAQPNYSHVISDWEFDSLNSRKIVPPEMKLRTTDADGRFEFTDLPDDCRFRIDVRPPGFPSRWILATTRAGVTQVHHGDIVYSGYAALTFVTPREIPIRVLYADTGKPAEKVLVEGMHAEGSVSRTSDADGLVTLRLPPGDIRYALLPEFGSPYLVTEGEIKVEATPVKEPIELKLNPAAIIEVTVVDALTGQPLPGVDLWIERPNPNGKPYRDLHYFRSWEVDTRIAHVERPTTGVDGKLTALFEPGWHPIGVGLRSFPKGYLSTEPDGRSVECLEGKTTRVTFKMRPKE